jgi:hypothetical protein
MRRRWKVWDKGKPNRWRDGDFSTVMDVIRDEGDWKLINFQQLVFLVSVYVSKGVGGQY